MRKNVIDVSWLGFALVLLTVMAAAWPAAAKDLIVDGKSPAAKNENLKNGQRPSENLPASAKTDLKFQADVLAFLHTGGWLLGDVQQATYIIHYADGTKAEIPVIGGKNIMDWTSASDAADELKYDPATGLLLHAVTIPSPKFVRVNVWMTLWKNPFPQKQIVALEMKTANAGIPGLIAVSTGKVKK